MSKKELLFSDQIENAKIEDAKIIIERGFILTVWLSLGYDGSGQGFGGYALGGAPFTDNALNNHKDQPNLAADFITHVMAIADVEDWSKLPGKIIRVRRGEGFGGEIKGIGHPVKNIWYFPSKAMKDLTEDKARGES